MKRRTFCQLATAAAVAIATPLAAAADADRPRSLIVNVGALGFSPATRAGVRLFDTDGDMPRLWETKLRHDPLEALLPLAGLTTAAEFDLLQAELGKRRIRCEIEETVVADGRTLVRWRAPGV